MLWIVPLSIVISPEHGRAQPVDDATLRLSLEVQRVHRNADVDGGHHAMDAKPAALDRHLSHMRRVRSEREVRGNAAAPPPRSRPAPARTLGNQLEDAFEAGGVEGCRVVTLVRIVGRLPEVRRIPRCPRRWRLTRRAAAPRAALGVHRCARGDHRTGTRPVRRRFAGDFPGRPRGGVPRSGLPAATGRIRGS